MRLRDVDSGGGLGTLRRHEQRLERRQKTASYSVGPSGMALAAHRARDRGAPASAYLKAAGIGVRPPGAWGRRAPAKPANEVTTGSTAEPSATNPNPKNLSKKGKTKAAKPANAVTTGFGVELSGLAARTITPLPPSENRSQVGHRSHCNIYYVTRSLGASTQRGR